MPAIKNPASLAFLQIVLSLYSLVFARIRRLDQTGGLAELLELCAWVRLSREECSGISLISLLHYSCLLVRRPRSDSVRVREFRQACCTTFNYSEEEMRRKRCQRQRRDRCRGCRRSTCVDDIPPFPSAFFIPVYCFPRRFTKKAIRVRGSCGSVQDP